MLLISFLFQTQIVNKVSWLLFQWAMHIIFAGDQTGSAYSRWGPAIPLNNNQNILLSMNLNVFFITTNIWLPSLNSDMILEFYILISKNSLGSLSLHLLALFSYPLFSTLVKKVTLLFRNNLCSLSGWYCMDHSSFNLCIVSRSRCEVSWFCTHV